MKQNGVVCEPEPLHLFFIFRFEYLISGPKSYRDVRETGPWNVLGETQCNLLSVAFSRTEFWKHGALIQRRNENT